MNPALQTQALALTLPSGEEELRGQAVHSELPVVFLNFPASHRLQITPVRVNPISHTHSDLDALPALDDVFAGQDVHEAFPVELLYVPNGQMVQELPCPV